MDKKKDEKFGGSTDTISSGEMPSESYVHAAVEIDMFHDASQGQTPSPCPAVQRSSPVVSISIPTPSGQAATSSSLSSTIDEPRPATFPIVQQTLPGGRLIEMRRSVSAGIYPLTHLTQSRLSTDNLPQHPLSPIIYILNPLNLTSPAPPAPLAPPASSSAVSTEQAMHTLLEILRRQTPPLSVSSALYDTAAFMMPRLPQYSPLTMSYQFPSEESLIQRRNRLRDSRRLYIITGTTIGIVIATTVGSSIFFYYHGL